MIYTLIIQCAPSSHSIAASALKFTKALIESDHCLYRIFFYGDAVLLANNNTVQPQDEADLFAQWRELVADHDIEAIVCIAAALKRGVLDAQEAERYEREPVTESPFVLSGLGQLIDACAHSDRVITFA